MNSLLIASFVAPDFIMAATFPLMSLTYTDDIDDNLLAVLSIFIQSLGMPGLAFLSFFIFGLHVLYLIFINTIDL